MVSNSVDSDSGKNRRLVLILLLVAAGAFGYYWKFMPRTPEEKAAAALRKEARQIAKARNEDFREARKEQTEAVKKVFAPLTFSEEERFPLPEDARLLTAVPEFPETAAPVVFLAPFTSPTPGEKATSATRILNDVVRFQLRAAPPDRMPINLVPHQMMVLPHARSGADDPLAERTPEQFLEDARALRADYFAYGQAGVLPNGHYVVRLGMMDLKTNQSGVFDQARPPEEIGLLLHAAVENLAGSFGLSPEDIKGAGMTVGVPTTPATLAFAALNRDDEVTAEDARAAVAADPDCPYVYESLIYKQLGDDMLPLVNEGLKRWPDDPRLLLMKTRVVSPAGSALMVSELTRRYPGNMAVNARHVDTIEPLLESSQAPEIAEHLEAEEAYLAECVKRRPEDWALLWQHAHFNSLCAGNLPLRKAMAAGRRPTEAEATRYTADTRKYVLAAIEQMEKSAALRPDCPRLQLDLLRYRISKGDVPVNDLVTLARRIAELDPGSVEAEYLVMEKLTDDPEQQVRIAKVAAERASAEKNTQAQFRAIAPLIQTMRKAINWQQEDENLDVLKTHPAVPVYVKTAEEIMERGDSPLWSGNLDTLSRIYRAHGDQAKINRLNEYMDGVYKKTDAAHSSGDWETCYRYARATWEAASTRRERQLYYVVKSLWKLKRYDEAIQYAETGIRHFPDKATFHYMFAVVALESNTRLKEAYEHAVVAIPKDRNNTGLRETLQKLGRKVGRPEKV